MRSTTTEAGEANIRAGVPVEGDVHERQTGERGVALITTMMVMSLMLMLALAVTFTAISDNNVTSNFKNSTAGFYAAEAGINSLNRLIHSQQLVLGALPNPLTVNTGQPTLDPQQFITAATSLLGTKETFPNNAAYITKVNITSLTMPYPASDNDPSHQARKITYINPTIPRLGQMEPYTVNYTVNSVGEGIAGLNGTVTLVQEGVINFMLMTTASSGGVRVGNFSEFALYLDKFNPYRPPGGFIYQGLGPGDRFAGKVHTNEMFGFWTGADGQDPPVFKGHVTQSSPTASFYRYGAGQPPSPVDANSEIVGGVVVAPQFLAGFERGVAPIPPAGNAFNQARAVLDGGFSLSSNAPTDAELAQGLRAASQLDTALPTPKDPTATTPDLPPGIYIPTDGEAMTGSGIYVMGDADQVLLSADPVGNRQTIKVIQGTQTVTMTIDMDAGTTTINTGLTTKTLRGIPLDRSVVSGGGRPGASLYVYGNISSLGGPGRDANSQPLPAIDSQFAITVTAGAAPSSNPQTPATGGNITLTGDLTYETPVVDAAGNPINPNATNFLGIYSSGGMINVPVDGRAPHDLTVNASMAAFGLTDGTGHPILDGNGNPIGGHIRSDLTNWQNTGNLGHFTLVGGMQSSVYDNFAVYDGSTHGFTYQGLWDARYDHNQSPPFYPGYVVDNGGPIGPAKAVVQMNNPTILSYKRIYYGTTPIGK